MRGPSYRRVPACLSSAGAYIADPSGCLPRNGDSDLCPSGYLASVAAYFNRSDWTYVRTNGAQVRERERARGREAPR